MAKPINPLFGFDAHGSIAKLLTFRRAGQRTIAESVPTHPDARSPAQLSWRTMYEACSALWHTLSDAEKTSWESLARSKHMTGFALWQSQCLRPNPGIYLPLAGGTMQGDILMATHKITGLPIPTLDPDAATKAYVDAAGGGFDPFAQYLTIIAWESPDSFQIQCDNDGEVDIGLPLASFWTDNNQNDRALLSTINYFYILFETSKQVVVEFIITYMDSLTNQNIWAIFSNSGATPPSGSFPHIGFLIDGKDIFATNGTLIGQTITDTGIDLELDYQQTRLKFVYIPGTNAKFYVNDELRVTHITNVDFTDDLSLRLGVITLENDYKGVGFGRVLIQKSYS